MPTICFGHIFPSHCLSVLPAGYFPTWSPNSHPLFLPPSSPFFVLSGMEAGGSHIKQALYPQSSQDHQRDHLWLLSQHNRVPPGSFPILCCQSSSSLPPGWPWQGQEQKQAGGGCKLSWAHSPAGRSRKSMASSECIRAGRIEVMSTSP